ncbi:hypothetical protein LAZ67_X004610 [Cordylochernes scorpioides]|uniref:Uncharacterized protein n=1 Tax=Cordylochernes scorpioides TaxID=51811 RepID=A0ABY6LXS7_9ARAC|nr:hypothetical protein LAZ67_X004610 [Cordylochernes scorpioides]
MKDRTKRIVGALVFSVVTYGCESWTLIKEKKAFKIGVGVGSRNGGKPAMSWLEGVKKTTRRLLDELRVMDAQEAKQHPMEDRWCNRFTGNGGIEKAMNRLVV